MLRIENVPKFIHGGNYVCDIPLDHLRSWLANQEEYRTVELNPDFQRGHVWTEKQQIAYVEFLLRGGQSSKDLYWNVPDRHKIKDGRFPTMQLVDGLQRFTACDKFMGNNLPVFGHYLHEWEDADVFTGMGGPCLRMHVNNLQSRKMVLQWYCELNGGVAHTEAELQRVKDMIKEIDGE